MAPYIRNGQWGTGGMSENKGSNEDAMMYYKRERPNNTAKSERYHMIKLSRRKLTR